MRPRILEIETPGGLLELLARGRPESGDGVSALLLHDGIRIAASIGAGQKFDSSSRVSGGCAVKLVTATLVARAVDDGLLRFTDSPQDVLGCGSPLGGLEGIRLHHLLTHSHGLDDSCMASCPRTQDGHIDLNALLAGLREFPVIAEPGSVYCYGGAGAWLCAALLERVTGERFTTLVRDVLAESSPQSGDEWGQEICGATGGDFSLSGIEAASLVEMHLKPDGGCRAEYSAYSALRDRYSFSIGDWHPVIRRVCMGWFDNGAGSYSCSGQGLQGSIAIRCIPEEGLVLVVTSQPSASPGNLAGQILVRQFGNAFPRESAGGPLWPAAAGASAMNSRCCGTYTCGKFTLVIAGEPGGSLRAVVFENECGIQSQKVLIKRRLVPVSESMFIPNPPEPEILRIIKFVNADPDSGAYRHVQTSNRALRRVRE